MSNDSHIALLTHQTDGSDGLTPGIHCKFSFDYRLGFPSEGFFLYRRKNNTNSCIDFEKITADSITLPHTLAAENFQMTIRSNRRNQLNIHNISENRQTAKTIDISNAEIVFSEHSCNLELIFHIGPNTHYLASITHSDQTNSSQNITFGNNRMYRLVIPKDALSLSFRGEGDLYLKSICCLECRDDGNWEKAINGNCGYGLPFLQNVDRDERLGEQQNRPESNSRIATSNDKLFFAGQAIKVLVH